MGYSVFETNLDHGSHEHILVEKRVVIRAILNDGLRALHGTLQ